MIPRFKTFVYKYKKITHPKTNQIAEYPVVHVLLKNGNESLETTMVVDSGSDISFIPEEMAEILKLKVGEEDVAHTMGGQLIPIKPSKVDMTLLRGGKKIQLGYIPIQVGAGIKGIDEDLGILLGRCPIFDMFKITFEQYKQQVIFEKIDTKWRPF